MSGDHDRSFRVLVPKVFYGIFNFIPDTIESLIESNMNRAPRAHGVAGSGCLQIKDPVGYIYTAPKYYHYFCKVGRVPYEAKDTIGVISEGLNFLEGHYSAEVAVPVEDRCFWLVADGC